MKSLHWLMLLALLFGAQLQAAENSTSEIDYPAVVAQLVAQGDVAVAAYDPEEGMDTGDSFSELYFDIFEGSGMEMAIGLRDPQRKMELESLFSTVIGQAARGRAPSELQKAWQTLRTELQITATNYSKIEADGFWSLVLQSFLILLREGLRRCW